MHRRRRTRVGVQCSCGARSWGVWHIVSYEVSTVVERLRWWLRL